MAHGFELVSEFQPAGDQPQAIDRLVSAFERQERNQVLLGVTGSGKTFTMANVIQRLQRPTLVLSHNKTPRSCCFAASVNNLPIQTCTLQLLGLFATS